MQNVFIYSKKAILDFYRLEEPIFNLVWGLGGVFRLYLPTPKRIWIKPEI